MRQHHSTPFEMVEFKFHVKLPIFVARQWIRHRTANVNEYSGRYSEMKDDFYMPELEQIRMQSAINKQGRDNIIPDDAIAATIRDEMLEEQNVSYRHYQKLLGTGLAREIARINLPVSNYTEWYWKIDLHNLFHFLKLRMDSHAQYEIRVYAEKIAEIVKIVVPIAYQSFDDYVLNSQTFSKLELNVLKSLIEKNIPDAENLVQQGLSKREALEFITKVQNI
jgi:thymidylate synthase (FAD)